MTTEFMGFEVPSLAEAPLHGHEKDREGHWVLCENPERPIGPGCISDARCDKCLLGMRADLINNGDSFAWSHEPLDGGGWATTSEMVEAGIAWREAGRPGE